MAEHAHEFTSSLEHYKKGLSPNGAIAVGLVSYIFLTESRAKAAALHSGHMTLLPGFADIREDPMSAFEWLSLPTFAAGIFRRFFSKGYGVTWGNEGIETTGDWFKLAGCTVASLAAAWAWQKHLEEKYAFAPSHVTGVGAARNAACPSNLYDSNNRCHLVKTNHITGKKFAGDPSPRAGSNFDDRGGQLCQCWANVDVFGNIQDHNSCYPSKNDASNKTNGFPGKPHDEQGGDYFSAVPCPAGMATSTVAPIASSSSTAPAAPTATTGWWPVHHDPMSVVPYGLYGETFHTIEAPAPIGPQYPEEFADVIVPFYGEGA